MALMSVARKRDMFQAMAHIPTFAQWEVHRAVVRVKAVLGGERAGKSYVTAAEMMACLYPQPEDEKPRRVALVAKKYAEARAELRYMIDMSQRLGLLQGKPSTPRTGKWGFDTIAKGTVENISLEDGKGELTGTGNYFDGVAFVEGRQAERHSFGIRMGAHGRDEGLGPLVWHLVGQHRPVQRLGRDVARAEPLGRASVLFALLV